MEIHESNGPDFGFQKNENETESENTSPRSSPERSRGKRIFVVHRHLGAILHYDFRIQVNGVLMSWALPSGPSMNPGDRRLAVSTTEKPLSYAAAGNKLFTPAEEGIMETWDRGICVPHSVYSSSCDDVNLLCQVREGRFSFTLRGRKLRGVFSLVRLNGTQATHWLLIKGNDKYAVNYEYDSERLVGERSLINKALRNQKFVR